jgi:CSLREA domain-containing protein
MRRRIVRSTRGRRAKGLFAAACTATALALAPASAGAAMITVNTLTDDNPVGSCSLREAIFNADNDPAVSANDCAVGVGDDDITFLPALTAPAGQQVIDLSPLGDLAINSNVQIVGPGAGELALDAPPNGRVLDSNGTTVGVTGVMIRNGAVSATSGAAQGGGISVTGTLTLTGVLVTNNTATATTTTAPPTTTADASGGGIYNIGTVILDHSTVSGNEVTATNATNDAGSAQARGGGIFSESGATLHIHHSVIDNNTATAKDDLDAGSPSPEAKGGGLSAASTFDADHSSFTRNDVDANSLVGTAGSQALGAGIFSRNAGALETSTVADNRTTTAAPNSGFALQEGGGIYHEISGLLTIKSTTIARNGYTAASSLQAGPNFASPNGTPPTIENTIISDPVVGTDNCVTGGAQPVSNGYNIDFDAVPGSTCDPTPAPSDLSLDPMLAPALAFNGGSTESLALLPGSPAIDAGMSTSQTLAGDQRGLTRPVDFSGLANAAGGNASDIGAFEVQRDCAAQTVPGESCPQPSVPSNPNPPSSAAAAGPTGQQAAALKKCAKIKSKAKKKKCKTKAKQLPI